MAKLQFWELPDVLLFRVVSFVSPPTHRAHTLLNLACVCRQSHEALLLDHKRSLWEHVLKEDYGSVTEQQRGTKRTSKRLKRAPIHRVREAHLLIRDNTEIAFYYLAEHAASKSNPLSLAKLRSLIDEYGPHLRLNQTVSSGGLFLVEVCRARHVKEATILQCVKELVETKRALLNLSTYESSQSSQTALCVASVRAMPNVVKYLLQRGSSCEIKCSGRFRLHTLPKKTLKCKSVTPLQFCKEMEAAEREAGASETARTDLNRCIKLLSGRK